MPKYFGTDGIRGVVNNDLTCELCYKVGKSLATYLKKYKKTNIVIIGQDTRVSGDMLAHSLASGLCDYGVSAKMIGIVPTGCVSYLAGKLDVGAGVMITASHNAPNMNGIKLISNLGYKFSKSQEKEIENLIEKTIVASKIKGNIINSTDLVGKYIDYLVNDIGCDLTGCNIAVDTAFGSCFNIAEKVFKNLNANIILINNDSYGEKINVDCGALNVSKLQYEVSLHKCDFGFAFDGDADRLIVVLSDGRVLDGDDLLFVLGSYLLHKNKLNSRVAVGTIMTNSGTEQSLKKLGINLVRCDVGDRNVIETMLKNNYCLGGESSGHICVSTLNTTCDALINSLFLLKIVVTEKINLNELLLHLQKIPQIIKNVPVTKNVRVGFDENKTLKKIIDKIIKNNDDCRIVVRPSGTENVIRIMVEGGELKSNKVINEIENCLKNFVK